MMITKTEKLLLRIGANLHFAVAVGHLACLFFLEYAFRAYGIEDVMMQLCGGHVWMLYAFTVMLAVGFAIAGLYALSAAGDIRRLPLLRLVIWLVAITSPTLTRTRLTLPSMSAVRSFSIFIAS